MIICSALYFPGWLSEPTSLIRDNRYYPAKSADCFPIWWYYLRRHYPDTKVILFADSSSPVPLRPLLEATLDEPWWESSGEIDVPHNGAMMDARVSVEWVDQFAGQYFRPMQRNLVEAIITAYRANDDLFWLDSDAFLNTDLRPLVAGYDAAASGIAHHQQTMDSVCTFLSARRLHALDDLGIDLPSFLTTMLNEGPTETRMHTLQEGGLYKLFCWGKTRSLGRDIELAHLSCYDRFMTFLRRNLLDTPEYRALVGQLERVNWEAMPGVERTFHDMLFPENALLPS